MNAIDISYHDLGFNTAIRDAIAIVGKKKEAGLIDANHIPNPAQPVSEPRDCDSAPVNIEERAIQNAQTPGLSEKARSFPGSAA